MASLQERVDKICFVIFSFLLSVLVSFIFRFFTLYFFIFYLLSFIFYLLSFIFCLLSFYPIILLSCYPVISFCLYFSSIFSISFFQCIIFVFFFAFYCSYFFLFLLFLRLSRKYLNDSPGSLINWYLMINNFPMFFSLSTVTRPIFISAPLI